MYRSLFLLGALASGVWIGGCASGGGSYDAGGGRSDAGARDGGGKPDQGDAGPSCLGDMCDEECVDLQRDIAH